MRGSLLLFFASLLVVNHSPAQQQDLGAPKKDWEKAIELYQAGKFREAEPVLEREAEALLKKGQPITAATVLNYSGLAKTFLGDYESAYAELQRAQNAFRTQRSPAGLTLSFASFGLFYREQGLCLDAFRSYVQARNTLLEGKDSIGADKFNQLLLTIIGGQAAVYLEQGSYLQARYELEKTRAALDGRFPFEEAEIRKNLAVSEASVGEHEQAAEDLIGAKQRYLETGNLAGLAQLEEVEAAMIARQGMHTRAIELLRESYKSFGELGLEVFQGRVSLQAARIMLELKAYGKAADAAWASREVFERKKNPAGFARASLLLGQVYTARGKRAQAQDFLHTASERFSSLNIIGDLAETDNTLGALYPWDQPESAQRAANSFSEALKLARATGDNQRTAESLHGLGLIALVTHKDNQLVLSYLEDAHSSAERSGSPALLAQIEVEVASINIKEHNDQKAADLLQMAMEHLVNIAAAGESSPISVLSIDKESDLLENMILMMIVFQFESTNSNALLAKFSSLGHNFAEIALNFTEQFRAWPSLETYSLSQQHRPEINLPPRLKKSEEEHVRQINILARRLSLTLTAQPDESRAKFSETLGELVRAREEFERFKQSLRTYQEQSVRTYAFLKYPTPVRMNEIQLKKNEAMLVFKILAGETAIWLLKPDGNLEFRVTKRISRDNQAPVQELMAEIMKRDSGDEKMLKERAETVCNLLKLPDLMRDLPRGTVVHVVPDDFLYRLPLETLVYRHRDNSLSFLGSDYDFVYHSSVSMFARTLLSLKSDSTKPNSLLAFAKPHNSKYGQLSEYPAMADIARGIAHQLDVPDKESYFFRTEYNASESYLKQLDRNGELKRFRYIVFAAHGFDRLPEAQDESSLLLTNGAGEDGYLSFEEIANLNTSADLVFLSSCHSAVSEAIFSFEGVLSLAKAFELAGAGSVVASLWEVDPEVSKQFANSFFYHLVREKKPKHLALKMARQELMNKYPSPYYWANFVLAGEP